MPVDEIVPLITTSAYRETYVMNPSSVDEANNRRSHNQQSHRALSIFYIESAPKTTSQTINQTTNSLMKSPTHLEASVRCDRCLSASMSRSFAVGPGKGTSYCMDCYAEVNRNNGALSVEDISYTSNLHQALAQESLSRPQSQDSAQSEVSHSQAW